ncbi:MAG: GEVED domain-containing protein [Flavobacterium sp.]
MKKILLLSLLFNTLSVLYSQKIQAPLNSCTSTIINQNNADNPVAMLPTENTLNSSYNGTFGYTVSYVNFNSITKYTDTSYNTKYTDFTNSDKTIVVAGNTYPLTVTLKSGSQNPEYFATYIDYNNDGKFDENEKITYTNIPENSPPTTISAMISIPTTAVKNTLLRMRVSGNGKNDITNGMINGTETFYVGDTKDFGIYIIDPQPDLKTEVIVESGNE